MSSDMRSGFDLENYVRCQVTKTADRRSHRFTQLLQQTCSGSISLTGNDLLSETISE